MRQLVVLFEHLRGVAAGAAVDPVHALAAALLAVLAAAAAAVLIAIVVQVSLVLWLGSRRTPPAANPSPPRAGWRSRGSSSAVRLAG